MTDGAPISGSLRNRLVAILVGGAAVLALLLFFAIRGYATQVAQQGQDSILGAAVTSILDAAAIRFGTVELDIPYASFSMLTTEADDRVFHAVWQDGQFLSGYEALPPAATTGDRLPVYRTVEFAGAPVRLVTASRTLIGADQRTRITVALAQTQDALAGTLQGISRNAALFGAGFFALATMLAFWATSTTIGQLSRLTTSVTRRGPQDLSPFVKPVPAEMGPLVASLNSLMGRLDHSLTQSEDFIAEAAHRVRTPLATVRSYAEATLQRVDKEENRKALRSMVRAIDESSRAASQLLDHAMITFRADHLDRHDIDLVDLVQELVLRLTPIADMRDLDLRVDAAGPVTCSADPILLQNAIRNILDNALKYSPPDGVVDIRVRADPLPCIEICDQGRGFPGDSLDSLAGRFTRGENSQGIIGSGLGLTIAKDVATAHGGALRLSNRPEGGACVSLSL
ncbi:sensor histidine kinase [Jannaschia sp. M317]|uniref:sensor histidine kinase n=1 Tax=Jannaschia sp. M317 TaxID=2867011 RepID=UPI0021A50E6B|nr:sensor histidine kinase [Jannaschia sp. M317]UWQ19356.1 sensor histidine kinase N-terminal domain-containing protein [Jannaschia sp. M317]